MLDKTRIDQLINVLKERRRNEQITTPLKDFFAKTQKPYLNNSMKCLMRYAARYYESNVMSDVTR